MHRKLLFLALFLTVVVFHFRAYSEAPNASPAVSAGTKTELVASASKVVGVWLTQDKDSHIEIFKRGDELVGKIIWVKEDLTKSLFDEKNPDEKLRSRAILGLELLHGFHSDSDNGGKWAGGKIYDPKSGKTYQAKLTLKEPDVLELRGFVGVPLFGRSETWTRFKP